MGGAFSKVLGTSGLGLTGETKSGGQDTTLDPFSRQMQQLRQEEMYNARQGSGGFTNMLQGLQDRSGLGYNTQNAINQYGDMANVRGLDPSDWYNQAMANTDYSGLQDQQNNFYNQNNQDYNNQAQAGYRMNQTGLGQANQASQDFYGGMQNNLANSMGQYRGDMNQANQQNRQDLANTFNQSNAGLNNTYAGQQGQINSLADAAQGQLGNQYQNQVGMNQQGFAGLQNNLNQGYQNTSNNVSGTMNSVDARLQGMNQSQSPEAMLAAGRDYYNQIAGPQVANNMASMGLARSGANEEAQAKAMASIAQPIVQQQSAQQAALNQQIAGARAGNLGQGSQNLANLGQQYNQLTNQTGTNMMNQQGQFGQQFMNQSGNIAGQQMGLQGQLGGQYMSQQGQMNQNYMNQLAAQNQAYMGQQGQMNQFGAGTQAQLGEGQANRLNQNYGQYNQANAAMNQFYGGLGAQNRMQQGQGMQGLQNQYQQNRYGIDQSRMGNNINYWDSRANRAFQNIGAQDYGRLQGYRGQSDRLNTYLSAMNGMGNNASTNIRSWGNQDEGLLDSQFGAALGGAVGKAMVPGSDIHIKENLDTFNSTNFLDKLTAYTYDYKQPELHGQGKQAGIIAQDLEKTELGKEAVIEVDGVKYIDYSKIQGVMMACLVDLNSRVKELVKRTKELESGNSKLE